MSPTTAPLTASEREARVADVTRRAARRVADRVAGAHLMFGGAFWLVFAAVMVAVPLVVHQAHATMGAGVLSASAYSARWMAFVVGAGALRSIASVHVAAGGTRSSLSTGVLRGSLVAAVGYGVAFAVARVGEQALFTALGWHWIAPPGLAGGAGGTLAGAGEALAVAAYALGGATAIAGFRSVRGRLGGYAVVVAALALMAVAEAATRTGTAGETLGAWLADRLGLDGPLGVAVGLAAAAAAVAVIAGLLGARLRRLELRPRA
jgi:hypothetical protein